mmetsp:Transcript_34145/g.76871  ORF Transcript_34145/g.76871 Transcript_34145/m.76871 type:complete len:219 (+) Transcript_34145:2962-3618(+)
MLLLSPKAGSGVDVFVGGSRLEPTNESRTWSAPPFSSPLAMVDGANEGGEVTKGASTGSFEILVTTFSDDSPSNLSSMFSCTQGASPSWPSFTSSVSAVCLETKPTTANVKVIPPNKMGTTPESFKSTDGTASVLNGEATCCVRYCVSFVEVGAGSRVMSFPEIISITFPPLQLKELDLVVWSSVNVGNGGLLGDSDSASTDKSATGAAFGSLDISVD